MTVRVLRADDPVRRTLEEAGWTVSSRSWAAQLHAADADLPALRARVERVAAVAAVRQLTDDDAAEALLLDERTRHDYPGGPATRHQPLTNESARVTQARIAFGAFGTTSSSDIDARLLAMTYVNLATAGDPAETDFTVVAPEARGRGLAMAVKAASIEWMLTQGVTRFRTGGSSHNAAIIAANRALGYVQDEEWVTLTAP